MLCTFSIWENTGNTLLSKVSGIRQEAWSVSHLDKEGTTVSSAQLLDTCVFLEITTPAILWNPLTHFQQEQMYWYNQILSIKHRFLNWASTLHWVRAMTNVSIYRMGHLVTWNQQIFTVLTIYPVLANTGKSLIAWVFATQHGYNITN